MLLSKASLLSCAARYCGCRKAAGCQVYEGGTRTGQDGQPRVFRSALQTGFQAVGDRLGHGGCCHITLTLCTGEARKADATAVATASTCGGQEGDQGRPAWPTQAYWPRDRSPQPDPDGGGWRVLSAETWRLVSSSNIALEVSFFFLFFLKY